LPALRRRGTVIVDTQLGILVVRERSGVYSLPGGAAHRHESREAAARRELNEETGLRTLESTFLFEFRGRVNSHKVFLIKASGVATPRKEVTGVAFYDGTNLKVSSATREIVQRYLSIRRKAGSDRPQSPPPPSSGLDPWKVLEVRRNASKDAVVASYKRLCKVWHPDTWPPELSPEQRKAIDDKMKEITEAYNLLREQGFA